MLKPARNSVEPVVAPRVRLTICVKGKIDKANPCAVCGSDERGNPPAGKAPELFKKEDLGPDAPVLAVVDIARDHEKIRPLLQGKGDGVLKSPECRFSQECSEGGRNIGKPGKRTVEVKVSAVNERNFPAAHRVFPLSAGRKGSSFWYTRHHSLQKSRLLYATASFFATRSCSLSFSRQRESRRGPLSPGACHRPVTMG